MQLEDQPKNGVAYKKNVYLLNTLQDNFSMQRSY